jgi:hypothetical protein
LGGDRWGVEVSGPKTPLQGTTERDLVLPQWCAHAVRADGTRISICHLPSPFQHIVLVPAFDLEMPRRTAETFRILANARPTPFISGQKSQKGEVNRQLYIIPIDDSSH